VPEAKTEQIATTLETLPADRAPTRRGLSAPWRRLVAERIRGLETLQDSLDGCIGCGCLSLTRCALFNPKDEAAAEGSGSRWLRHAQEQP